MSVWIYMMLLCSTAAFCQKPSVDTILQHNYAASGGPVVSTRATLKAIYWYSGQGLTGEISSVVDLRNGAYINSYDTPPIAGANGFDGSRAWMQDHSGAITPEAGGDKLPLAVNEAYRDSHAWWRADRGGATIEYAGIEHANNHSFDVLQVTPKAGKPFMAWFDVGTGLLTRIIEKQGFQTITTSYDDYKSIADVMIAHKVVIDDGSGPAGLQTQMLRTATFLPAKSASFYARQPFVPNDTFLAAAANETTIPFQLLNNHVYIQVFINNKGPFRFIVDTGGHDILVPRVARALGLVILGHALAFGAGQGSIESGYAQVQSIRLGAATLQNQVVNVLQFQPDAVEGFPTDGMIGFEVLRRFVTRIDYRAKTITLARPRTFKPDQSAIPVPFTFYDHMPQIDGSFLHWAGRFNLDTGSRVELTLTKPFIDSHQLRHKFPRGVVAVNGWGVGGPTRSYVTRATEIRLGTITIPDVVTSFAIGDKGAFADPSYEGNVGTPLLKRFDVTFDYDRQTVYLKPLVAPVPDIATFDRSGMWINGENAHFTIMVITPGGPAAQAGLKAGDEIIAVNGKAVDASNLSNFRQKLRNDPPGTLLSLTILHRGRKQTLRLSLRDQITADPNDS